MEALSINVFKKSIQFSMYFQHLLYIFEDLLHIFEVLLHIFRHLLHSFEVLLHIFRDLLHISGLLLHLLEINYQFYFFTPLYRFPLLLSFAGAGTSI
jgi:hypothetical protein